MTLSAARLDRRSPKPQTSKRAEQTFHDNQDLNRCISSTVAWLATGCSKSVRDKSQRTVALTLTLPRQATIKLESLGFLNDQFLEIRMLRIENVVPFFDDRRRGYFQ